jgi:putative sterol carrier protein
MADPTAAFLEQLAQRGQDPLLEKASGTVRLELVGGKRVDTWLVTVEHGRLAVANEDRPADLTMRAEKAVFDGLASGKVNPVAALLRGALTIEGDWELAVLIQRLFPGPPAKRASRSNGGRKPKPGGGAKK